MELRPHSPAGLCTLAPDDEAIRRLCLRLHNQFTAQHTHLALETILARLVRCEFNADFLAFRQPGAAAKVGEEHRFGAGGALLAGEAQAHRLPGLDDDDVRRVAAFDGDGDLLNAARAGRDAGPALRREPEEPGDEAAQGDPCQRAAVPNVAWFLTTEITKNAEKLPICV